MQVATSSLLVISTIGLGCSDDVSDVPAQGSTGAAATTESPSSSNGGTTTRPDPGDSSSTVDASDTSGSPEPSCGDGELDLLEQCDDGNQEDSDGCSRDCLESGSLSWVVMHPDGVDFVRFALTPDDSILVAAEVDDNGSIFTFSSTGEELSQEMIPPLNPPPGTTSTEVTLWDIDSGPRGNAIYSGHASFFPADGPPTPRGFLMGLGDELQPIDLVGLFEFGVTDGHGVYGASHGGSLSRFDARGVLELERHDDLRPTHLVVTDHGVVLGEDALSSYDSNGALQWTYPWPSFEAGGRIASLSAFENGDVLVVGVERDADEQRIRLVRLGADGSEVHSSPWPSSEFSKDTRSVSAAIGPNGDVVLSGMWDGFQRHLAKLDENFEPRWDRPVDFSGEIAVTSTGATVMLSQVAMIGGAAVNDVLSRYSP